MPDMSQYKGIISEVSLIFKCDPNRIYERLKENASKLNFLKEKVSYSEICLQYFKVNRNLITLPLVLVEDESHLEVRDCYLRSIKKDSSKNSPDINISPVNFEMEEIGFWVNGEYLYDF
jgi:hypothetical protein